MSRINRDTEPGCDLVLENQCPTVCGGTWKEWQLDERQWKVAPSISVTCKGTFSTNNSDYP